MIQVRTATLNDELRDEFVGWYPHMNNVEGQQNVASYNDSLRLLN